MLPTPKHIVARVGDDPENPRPERASLELIEVSIGGEEGILRDVGRGVAVANQPQGYVEGKILPGEHKLIKGDSVASACLGDKVSFVVFAAERRGRRHRMLS